MKPWLVLVICAIHVASCHQSIAEDNRSLHGQKDGSGTSAGSPEDAVVCHEDRPLCDIATTYHDTYPASFFIPEQTYVEPHVYLIKVNESHEVCALDPSHLITNGTAQGPALAEIYMVIYCFNNHTRLVFKPARNLRHARLFLTLDIRNCTVYWKDISYLAQAIDIRVLYLGDWYDEFSRNESAYYDRCVDVDAAWNADNSTNRSWPPDDLLSTSIERPLPPIKGLAGVGTLDIKRPGSAVLSPVFTRHVWPRMAEVAFTSCYIGTTAARLIPWTMPQLQTLEMTDVTPSALIPEFPWTNNTLLLPLNLSRTAIFNDHYSDSIGIQLLPPNTYRRIYVLHGVILADLSEFSFHGTLHRIQLKNCNITTLSNRTFSDVHDLQSLEISHNAIENVPVGVFSDLDHLVTLQLDYNALRRLPPGLFQGIRNLKHIDLSGNRLIEIDAFTFSNLQSLEMIDLSYNELRHISDGAMGREWSDFLYLHSVKLNNNDLGDFPVWLVYLRYLTRIDLSSNRLSFSGQDSVLGRLIPDVVRYSNTHSGSTAEEAFRPASQKNINLKNNRFSSFDLAMMNSTQILNLKTLLNFFELDFRDNPLECDCKMFQFYEYLQGESASQSATYETLKVLPYNLENIQCNSSSGEISIPVANAPATIFGCIEQVPGCPRSCDCWVRTLDSAIVVKCASRSLRSLPRAVPNKTFHVDLRGNDITSIPMPLPKYVDGLEKIDLSHNRLEDVDASFLALSERVSELLLHGNNLQSIPRGASRMTRTVSVTLAGNPFVCDCHSLWLKQWLVTRRDQVLDLDQVTCATGQLGGKVLIDVPSEEFICEVDPVIYIASAGTVAGVLLLIIVAAIPAYKYRGEIKIYLYMHFDWHPFDRTDDTDILGKDFDAFVSYSREDAHWVCHVLRPRLEPKFHLCLHDRDFRVGAAVAENICSAVNTSRRMILVLSRAFLRSNWCYLEFRQAHYRALKDRSNYLIVVLHEDVSAEDLDKDLQMYLKTNTYLSPDNRWFWQKLLYAMPQRPLRELLSTVSDGKQSRNPHRGTDQPNHQADTQDGGTHPFVIHSNSSPTGQYNGPKNSYIDESTVGSCSSF